jgi:hypothetical protein
VIFRAGLIGGVVSVVFDVAWSLATHPATGSDSVLENGSLLVGVAVWIGVGYVASRGISIRSASAAALLALAIDAFIADLIAPILTGNYRPTQGTETWVALATVLIGSLVATCAGAVGGLVARARYARTR